MLNHETLREFFEAVLREDSETLARIEASPANTRIEQQLFIFSISALLELLDPRGETELKTFRKLLYTSELNRELRERGAQISIYHSTGKVDSNLYCLKAT
jgi:hypothetical protein